MKENTKNKQTHVIITGAANGIGNQMAKTMIAHGYQVTLCDLDNNSLQKQFADLPKSQVLIKKLNITSAEEWKSVLAAAIKTFGKIDYLFNIAGVVVPGFAHELALKDFDLQMDVNAKGNIYGAKLCAEQMIRQGHGHIINVVSLAGLNPVGGLAAYSASKYALRGFSLAMAADIKHLGVDVTIICPDLVKTHQFDLQLDYPKESALVFSGRKPLTVHDVEKAFWRAMKKKPLQIALPFYRGVLSKIGDLFPAFALKITSGMRKSGERKILQAKKDHQKSANKVLSAFLFVASSVVILGTLTSPISAAVLKGKISSTKKIGLAGAMVTLSSPDGFISETAYSDQHGNYSLPTRLSGKLKLRVRSPLFADSYKNIFLKNNSNEQTINFTVTRLQSAKEFSDQLTASAHAATLSFDNENLKETFRSQCHFCHQIGNAWTRLPRSEPAWKLTIQRMEYFGVFLTNHERAAFAGMLTKTFQGKPIKAMQTWDYSPELAQAIYKEWRIGDAMSYVHDIESYRDGKLYGVDMGNDKIYIIDPKTNIQNVIDFPESDLPMGGLFAGAYAPLGTFNAKHGPHSVQEGPDGKLYTTNSLAAEISTFDPKTNEWEIFPIGKDAIYPHTLRFDKEGILWFTLAISNQIGRFDPATKEFTIIDTPSHGFWRWVSDALSYTVLKIASWFPKENYHMKLSHHKLTGKGYHILNLPYGIDVHPIDGSIWYSKLYSSYIGRIDPKTLEVEEFPSPLKGPRRLRFAKDGTLWIPSFVEGKLIKMNTKTRKSEIIEIPTLAPKEYEIPYALNIHPETQDVWITSNLSDRVFRYIPSQKRFISYPSPTKVTYLRDIVFHSDGGVCSSNANLPAAAIEGKQQNMLCIYTDKNALH